MGDNVWQAFFDSFAPQYMGEPLTREFARQTVFLVDTLGLPAEARAAAEAAGVQFDEHEIMVVMRRPGRDGAA